MFSLNDSNYLRDVDYHNKFLVVKRTESLSADGPILSCKLFLQNMGYGRENFQMQGAIFFQRNGENFAETFV